MSRLRQAKDEAESEVANYRSHLEAEYQKSISEVNIIFIWDVIKSYSLCLIDFGLIYAVKWELRLNGEKA